MQQLDLLLVQRTELPLVRQMEPPLETLLVKHLVLPRVLHSEQRLEQSWVLQSVQQWALPLVEP